MTAPMRFTVKVEQGAENSAGARENANEETEIEQYVRGDRKTQQTRQKNTANETEKHSKRDKNTANERGAQQTRECRSRGRRYDQFPKNRFPSASSKYRIVSPP